MRLSVRLAVVTLAASAVSLVPALSSASILQGEVVSDNPVNYTPRLTYGGSGPKPHVDAMAPPRLGNTLYAGGLFDGAVSADGTRTYPRQNMMAFNADNGDMSGTFAPNVNGNVWAVEATATAVYVGGDFTTVNGVSRPGLAKLDPLTGAVDTGFQAPFKGGRVNEIELLGNRLIVGGSAGTKLMALNPTTGKNTFTLTLPITEAIPLAWGGVAVYDFAINPAGTQLVATGNFKTVDGLPRTRFFMADLTPTAATVTDWYYQPFAEKCASEHPRRIAYLQGIDYSPDGSYFVVAATGQVAPKGFKNVRVCDAAARFDVATDSKAAWINYTGGDSVWAVAATGAAVYAQGHFQWLDNTNGSASTCPASDLATCDSRKGVGAIDPQSGQALPWNPRKPAQLGGKAFLATTAGLWIGSDSEKINGEQHRGIGLMPLP
ncbi:MAG: delta-60 repeat domain-containing protein [Sporichthyaceae bacterium]|nr:delta-60 repeat domain-containing protein [Sporichthyaceae bacterium]